MRIRKGIHLIAFCAVGLGFLYGTSDAEEPRQTRRVRNGLVALYDFGSVQDKRLPDRSGLGEAADLRLGETEAVQLTAGYLAIGTPTRIQSLDRPAKISDLVRVLGELTVEVWIEPSADNGSEPASIVTMSNGTDQQNFEFGQDNGRFQVHFRTSQTGRVGAPPISTPNGTALPELTHVVFTHDRSGRARMFLNGKIAVERIIPGSTLDWEKTTLMIGNGPRGKRPWLGIYRLVAIYGRDLLADEVARNFLAGPSPPSIEISNVSHNQSLFEAKVAPLLASRCLDCHDSAVRQGGLDLSRRETALAGGDHGNAIVPGNANSSLVWLMTLSDSMPQNRPPLSIKEKQALREWIDGGADWTYETLDSSIYERSDRAISN